ncbi:MAG TPA: choice-of-anchor J domain-containing protein [Flavobacteriales bacterium]
MKNLYTSALALMIGTGAVAQDTYTQNFDDLSTSGWTVVNNSNPLGTTQWAQGDGGLGVDAGHSGSETSYVSDTYTATTESGTGTISDWLISPEVTVNAGDSISFWTISFNNATFADRLEVRLSPDGGSDVGTSETSVGDFTELVFTINPDLTNTDYPSIQVDGDTWTYYGGISTISGTVRIGLRYHVTDGGGMGSNGSSIGIDDVRISANSSSVSELALNGVRFSPNPTNDVVNVRVTTSGSHLISVLNAAGQVVRSFNSLSDMTPIDLTSMEAGIYVVEVRQATTGAVARERVVKF